MTEVFTDKKVKILHCDARPAATIALFNGVAVKRIQNIIIIFSNYYFPS